MPQDRCSLDEALLVEEDIVQLEVSAPRKMSCQTAILVGTFELQLGFGTMTDLAFVQVADSQHLAAGSRMRSTILSPSMPERLRVKSCTMLAVWNLTMSAVPWKTCQRTCNKLQVMPFERKSSCIS